MTLLRLTGVILLLFGWGFAFGLFLWMHYRSRFFGLLPLAMLVGVLVMGIGIVIVDLLAGHGLPESLAYPWFCLPHLYIVVVAFRFFISKGSRKS